MQWIGSEVITTSEQLKQTTSVGLSKRSQCRFDSSAAFELDEIACPSMGDEKIEIIATGRIVLFNGLPNSGDGMTGASH
jgi:hypothetical protein